MEASRKHRGRSATRNVKRDGNEHTSPCWHHLRLLLDPADRFSRPTPSKRRGTAARNVLQPKSTPGWPRRSPAEHKHELQPDVATFATGADAPRRTGGSSGSPSTGHWYEHGPPRSSRRSKANARRRLRRGIQCHTSSATTSAECPGWRKSAICAAHPPHRSPTTGLPHFVDAFGHGG